MTDDELLALADALLRFAAWFGDPILAEAAEHYQHAATAATMNDRVRAILLGERAEARCRLLGGELAAHRRGPLGSRELRVLMAGALDRLLDARPDPRRWHRR